WYKMKHPYNPFRKEESLKCAGGLMELLGNVCYTYAVAINPVLVTPITSSYCIVTIFAARILLKEKLQKKQYICLAILAAGILILAISEGRK
ncbi:MAG: EamA family transporter, partial [Lachnospiraceae bacterium]